MRALVTECPLVSTVPRYNYKSVDAKSFRKLWSAGIPIVVFDVPTRNVDPSYFSKNFADLKVTMEDCEANEPNMKVALGDFIQDFGRCINPTGVWKVKDLPPKDSFSEILAAVWLKYMDILPIPDICRYDGIRNLASHYPPNGAGPDLGPKAYIAQGTTQDNSHSGSTVLHMDLTSAINVMTWGATHATGVRGFAIWHIFPSDSVHTLRQFLVDATAYDGIGDIIHSQTVCVTPAMLDILASVHNIRPYVIKQSPGEAVFIPAGCPHQVSNACDAIKIALDFLDVESLNRTVQLAHEFRNHRKATSQGDDVLQLNTLLWYAWVSLTEQFDKLDGDGTTRVSRARRRRKAKDQLSAAGIRKKDKGLECSCPLCARVVNRPNLVAHLLHEHIGHINVSALMGNPSIGSPTRMTNSEASTFIQKHILLEDGEVVI
ncbi:hypothetical protein HWV62_22363 [Athelia sp. TMB]|nr:hypothetical protein HWV62_22363 [Athelia sp. TMB]